MDRLVEATLPHGLVPLVVMEFPGITVGGGYNGTSGESSSFKHGYFNTTINFVEMVLANGEIVRCSGVDKPDLFHGAAGALGTFGVTTLVELQLKEAKKYVETTYHPVTCASEAVHSIRRMTLDPSLDYIDGILFSKQQGAVITGCMTDSPGDDVSVQYFSDSKDPWFYLRVKDAITQSNEAVTEAIPIAEYLFRYDRGGFWVGAGAFEYFKVPFNRLTRGWLDDLLHTRMLYSALHASGQSRRFVVQDLALPYATVERFIDYTDDAFGIYPLWLCPLKQSQTPTFHPHLHEIEDDGRTWKGMLNVGLWGWGPSNAAEFVRLNRNLEDKLRELSGMKWLYAQIYYTEDDFWSIYGRQWYDALRLKYNAQFLPSVYDKVKISSENGDSSWALRFAHSMKNIRPLGGIYGLKRAITSGSYLPARKSAWKSA